MKKFFIGLAIAGGGVLVFLFFMPAEPKYEGKPISRLLDDSAAKKSRDFPAALKHVDTNALPYVVRNLAWNDSWWHTNYSRLQRKLPKPLQRFFQTPKPLLSDLNGANIFFYLGSNSIPHAIALLKHKSPTVRRAAAMALGSLRRQSPAATQAIPALIAALNDEDRMVRFFAAGSLKEMGANASNAVPALTKVVAYTGVGSQTNNFFYVRAVAAVALGKIGPAASNALPTLKAALQESNSYLRGQTAVAIWRIASDVDTALPVLLQEMPTTIGDSKWDWIIALGEMGPRAKQAIPQLRIELEANYQKWILAYVTNAIKSIDPEAATEAGVK